MEAAKTGIEISPGPESYHNQDGAVVHAKPHLEIFASDVKCSHGATTGRLDQEALFYLRALQKYGFTQEAERLGARSRA